MRLRSEITRDPTIFRPGKGQGKTTLTSLKTQALRLLMKLDQELEMVEESSHPNLLVTVSRTRKLHRLIIQAELRLYRRSQGGMSSYDLARTLAPEAVPVPPAITTQPVEMGTAEEATSAGLAALPIVAPTGILGTAPSFSPEWLKPDLVQNGLK